MTDKDAWQRVTEQAVSHFDHLDILVNSAGILAGGTVENTSLAEWRRTILLSQLGKQDEEDRIHRRGFGASPGLTGQP